ncbi:hypothetical protein [Sulfobacillus harzensis]|uniref:Uncharacterized protein n=1 Tax=Sulfobacillus harzensis TaxID=2729629 RepID=A0A7Y0Q3S4_9FIRM|nr:hypothetical protein [Sulfobacillus harzensis]NMP23296.1 hypothetical protein [Sulfobacillus harzensis]
MKFGTWLSIIGILAGAWVILAPEIVGFAPTHGNPWTGPMLGSAILGGLIMLTALVGLVAFWGLRLRELGNQSPEQQDA